MSIAAAATIEDQSPEIEVPAPVIVLRAASDSTTPPVETESTDNDRDDRSTSAKLRDWYSGWCGPGPCADGRFETDSGEPRIMCKGFARNGENAGVAVLHCACTCHADDPDAVDAEGEA